MPTAQYPADQLHQLADKAKQWGRELGFAQLGIADIDLSAQEPAFRQWLAEGYHGSMSWMLERADMRLNPDQLQPGCVRVLSARMNYLPADTEQIRVLKDGDKAYISRYALGRDYHKLIRKRLATLAKQIEAEAKRLWPEFEVSQRAFVDSAPVMERPLAEKAGLGWTGKHTLIINREAGSWFFLGEILTNIPLPVDQNPQTNECGSCSACLKVCPTDAFPEPYVLDARRCISYLTIENDGPIPLEFREPIGNRVFGCDDCQAICPWNKYASFTDEKDFSPRHNLDKSRLVDLFLWDEKTFLDNTAGSPIRRIGYRNWLRNLAVGLGNAPSSIEIVEALKNRRVHAQESADELLLEHIDWALAQQAEPERRRKRKIKAGPASAPKSNP